MAKEKTTLRFWLRADRKNQDGTAPVHLVYQLQGQKKCYSVPGIKLLPVNWNAEDQEASYIDRKAAKRKDPSIDTDLLLTSTDIEEINTKLSSVITEFRDAEKRFQLDRLTYTPQMVIDFVKASKKPLAQKDQPAVYIVDFINKFCLETTDHREGTIKAYKGLANHMANFEAIKRIRFAFEGDASILKSFSGYLSSLTIFNKKANREERKINNITKSKLFGTFKTILRHAKRHPYKTKVNPDYLDYQEKSLRRRDSDFEIIALTSDELSAIIALDLSGSKSLDEARDIFCFSCTTGLRYGDLKQLSRKHIRKDNTIYIPASDKNSKPIEVPLNPISHSIIQKYRNLLTPLPVTSHKQELISDQKLNNHIKKIGQLAGIDSEIEIVRPYGLEDISLGVYKKYELLSIHCGRKTFTTLSLEKGVPIQDVMALTTHSSFKAVKRYINVTKQRKKTVMAEAWGSVNDNNLKAV